MQSSAQANVIFSNLEFLVQAGLCVNAVANLSSGPECWQGNLASAVEPGQSKSLSAQCGFADCI